MGSALMGCNSNESPNNNVNPPPAPNPAPINRLSWTVKLQNKCAEEVAPTECLAGFGFSVNTNGEYQVGPGPKGELRQGKLTEEEKNAITSALSSTLVEGNLRAESHNTIEEDSQNQFTVSLLKGNAAPESLVRTGGTDFFFQTQSENEAKTLLNALRSYAEKYASNFPDDCLDGANSLQALFDSMQTCSSDAECVYLDSFEPVAANSGSEIVVDDCSIVKPLAVGNAELVRINQSKLIESLDTVRAACDFKMVRDNCTNSTPFTLSGANPVCSQGVCKLPGQQ